jgi:hypothetical protein
MFSGPLQVLFPMPALVVYYSVLTPLMPSSDTVNSSVVHLQNVHLSIIDPSLYVIINQDYFL